MIVIPSFRALLLIITNIQGIHSDPGPLKIAFQCTTPAAPFLLSRGFTGIGIFYTALLFWIAHLQK